MIIGYTVAEALGLAVRFSRSARTGDDAAARISSRTTGERVVIVEDVVTTGKSTRETADVIAQHGGRVVGFASILNRSGKANPFDAPYESLMALDLETYEESACPLCASGRAARCTGVAVTRT